ncbi:MAG: sodium:proton exchanger [Polyangiaceae bacterium]|nr:sodium:proton exchanger [Polyangiaceae bacterium]
MHGLDLIFTLAMGLGVALVFGFLTQKMRMSPIVGYLIAGVFVGPFTPGLVAHAGIAEQLAELGVILLMFGVGLHFHLKELLAVRKVALPGAAVQIAIATILGVVVTKAFGWTVGSGVVFGLAISVASTVVLLRVLADKGLLHSRPGHIAVGWLIVEDLFTVIVLVMLPVVVHSSTTGAGAGAIASSLALTVGKIALFVVFTLFVGGKVIPKILAFVAKTRSRELFTLAVLALALGIAVEAAELFGASMALGAFLAGMVVGQSEFASRAASEALPLRDAFAVLFFVSVGMLFDPRALVESWPIVVATLGVVLIGKPLAAVAVCAVLRQPLRTGLTVGFALGQIGEFSFILATLARDLGVLPPIAMQALVSTAIISITINPLLFRIVEPLARWAAAGRGNVEPVPAEVDPSRRAVVVGYGPVGRTVIDLLRDSGIEPTVIELNHETVRDLAKEGIRAVYGDASQRLILEEAGVATSASLIYAASGSPPDELIRTAKELKDDIVIIVRAAYLHEVEPLKRAGADIVVASEGEVALAMTDQILADMGADPDRLNRARSHVRRRFGLRDVGLHHVESR